MSLPTITLANPYSKLVLLLLVSTMNLAHADGWKIDFSRRTKDLPKEDLQRIEMNAESAMVPKKEEMTLLEAVFPAGEPMQEIVILNTEKGFVPSTVRVRQGLNYKINVVNVNEKDRNISFVLDSFSEHHATYYGKIKTFLIRPKQEGIFTFNSPETSAQGKIVVYPAGPSGASVPVRVPSSTPE